MIPSLILGAILIGLHGDEVNGCVSFYCINSCGSSPSTNNGYKLILANNRDEDINRPTKPADKWPFADEFPAKNTVYGALDVLRGHAPEVYSTWLGMNDFGNVANLLFYRETNVSRRNLTLDNRGRGIIVPNYVHRNAMDYEATNYLDDFEKIKFNYKGTNLVLLEMSKHTGNYSIYYMNNTSAEPYRKLNPDDNSRFVFAVSNSEPEKPFRKVVEGKIMFEKFIDEYSRSLNKEQLIDSMMSSLLHNKTAFYPDENLASSMGLNDAGEYRDLISNVSAIKADYLISWPGARTRTSTLILVDNQDNVEYYELNLTLTKNLEEIWAFTNLSFKLNPMYKSDAMQPRHAFITWIIAILSGFLIFFFF